MSSSSTNRSLGLLYGNLEVAHWLHRFLLISAQCAVLLAAQVLTVVDSIPDIGPFLNSLYYCRYREFFQVRSTIKRASNAQSQLGPTMRSTGSANASMPQTFAHCVSLWSSSFADGCHRQGFTYGCD